jgi:hypothetical protein
VRSEQDRPAAQRTQHLHGSMDRVSTSQVVHDPRNHSMARAEALRPIASSAVMLEGQVRSIANNDAIDRWRGQQTHGMTAS